jgi:hypothetical protein
MKRIFIGLIIFMALLISTGIWAGTTITTPAIDYFPSGSNSGAFIVNAKTTDASPCEVLIAAPGSGKSIYLKHITINATSPNTVTIGEGETTPGSVDTVLIGPANLAAGGVLQFDFYPPLKLTSNKLLAVDATDTGAIMFFIQGYTE